MQSAFLIYTTKVLGNNNTTFNVINISLIMALCNI